MTLDHTYSAYCRLNMLPKVGVAKLYRLRLHTKLPTPSPQSCSRAPILMPDLASPGKRNHANCINSWCCGEPTVARRLEAGCPLVAAATRRRAPTSTLRPRKVPALAGPNRRVTVCPVAPASARCRPVASTHHLG